MRILALFIAAAAAISVTYFRLLRPWHSRWGASEEEIEKPLPGDELAPEPQFQSTRAITIEAPPGDVWPWLVQLGYGRGGFYSYDIFENAFARLFRMDARYKSIDEIRPELQTLRVGDFVPAAPREWREGKYADKIGWTVKRLEAPRVMVLENWGAFVLEPLDGQRTRLIVRTRGGKTRKDAVGYLPWELPHFIMERKMLYGIKERAERLATEKQQVRPAVPAAPAVQT
jgi:hypothetical protein